MDSNTAYHFSRLLQTTPYLGHCSRVVKMERYRVCAAGREEEWREKFPRFRETRIVTRHRATRPVLITFRSASNFTLTRLSARRIFSSFFFFLLLFPSKEKHSTTAQTSEGDRSAETISPPFLSPSVARRANNPSNRPKPRNFAARNRIQTLRVQPVGF